MKWIDIFFSFTFLIMASSAIGQTPACIQQKIKNADSLIKAGVASVQSVTMAGHTLYYFDKPVPKLPGTDRAYTVVYYDSLCNKLTFSVGGIAGILPPKGYTVKDFTARKTIAYLWKASDIKSSSQAVNNTTPLNFFTIPQRYEVITTDSVLPFKKGDVLMFSAAQGLYHYRQTRLLNRYKMIPEKAEEVYTNPCLIAPCPTDKRAIVALNVEPLHSYFKMSEGTSRSFLMICKMTAAQKKSFTESDWTAGIELKKK